MPPVVAAPPQPEVNNNDADNPNPNAAAAAAAIQGPSSLLSGKRLFIYGAITTASAVAVTFNAFRQRSNYYAAAVWLGRSNGCMLILLNFGIFSALMYALAVQWVFFGQLRPIEVEHLHERAWYALTESLLAMTIFRDEFDAKFVIMFGTLLFLKVFHWLSEDRVDYMEQTPSVSKLFHVRMISMLSTMALVDLALVAWSLEAIYLDSKQLGLTIMFSTEFMVLLASNFSIGSKYVINCIDAYSEDVWEKKSMYVFYVDLLTDFIKLLVYTFFFSFILATYGFPFNLVRDVVFTARSFFGRVRDLIRYREATKNMNERYPDASVRDMEALSDGTCIICRDDMLVAGAEGTPPGQPSAQETPKKLPCGHIFHFHCLRSWLERQQSCPTCRRTVLQTGETAAAGAAAGGQDAGAGAARDGPPPPEPGARPAAPTAAAGTGAAAATATATANPTPTPTRAPGVDETRTNAPTAGTSVAAPTRLPTPPINHSRRRGERERDGDGWSVQGSLDRIRRGMEQTRAEAEMRRTEWDAAQGVPGSSSQQARSSSTTTNRADLDRIPMTFLEMLFETSLGQEREVRELEKAVPQVVLPLSHATGSTTRSAWVPPRPEEFPALKSTTTAILLGVPTPRSSTSTSVARTEFVRSGAPSPSTASESQPAAVVDGKEEVGEGGEDPDDPRRAVREAALRRFGGMVPSPAPAAAAADESATTPVGAGSAPTLDEASQPDVKGKGKEVVREAETTTLPGNPRLTPLSGPRTPSSKLDLPFPLEKNSGTSLVPSTLSDEAVEERLRNLERLQGVIGDAVGELQRMLRPDAAGTTATTTGTEAAGGAGGSSAQDD
ncbi:hypothetical protein A4X13_0g6202 [Tilletia indica]|uniref:RING-type E3 ubiquitin transferase n=1 Tax=Tilletia indica TaxID=43049 RepID=A0A177TDF4_9BASI|nr:hypothetical protein A4X13_0g6202 [Tilletia indica]